MRSLDPGNGWDTTTLMNRGWGRMRKVNKKRRMQNTTRSIYKDLTTVFPRK